MHLTWIIQSFFPALQLHFTYVARALRSVVFVFQYSAFVAKILGILRRCLGSFLNETTGKFKQVVDKASLYEIQPLHRNTSNRSFG
jgi:hypothetical protein